MILRHRSDRLKPWPQSQTGSDLLDSAGLVAQRVAGTRRRLQPPYSPVPLP